MNTITNIDSITNVLYTGKTHTTGGRDGAAVSTDGHLDVKLSAPGSNRPGTNPEQLFAAGWSACFIGAMRHAASGLHVTVPAGVAVDTAVDLGTGSTGFLLQARLNVSLPGLDHDIAQTLINAAHETCPYSKATRGNINVTITLV